MESTGREALEVRRQMFRFEPWVLLVLSIHGAFVLLITSGQPWHWLALSAVLLTGVISWRYPKIPLLVRFLLFLCLTWLLLMSGGTGSFFFLWLFVAVAFYPLLFSRPAHLIVTGMVSLSYLLLLPLPESQVPLFVVLGRAFLLVFIGWVVSVLGDTLVNYAEQRQKLEENLQRILSASPSAIIVVRMEDGRYLDVNDHFLRLTGFERSEIVGKSVGEVSFWAIPEERNISITAVQQQGYIHNFEISVRRKSGEVGSVIINSEIVELNGLDCLVTFAHDVTEWRKSEEEKLYQANLLDNVSDAVISTDANFIIRSWNKGAERLYGWQAEEAIGQRLRKFVPTEYLDTNESTVTAQILAQGHWQGEVIQSCQDGTKRNVLSAVSAITNHQNELLGTVDINRDITAQKELQAALRQQEVLYEAVVEGQTELISRHLPDTTITFVNEAYCRYFGYHREELIGKKIDAFLPRPLMDLVRAKFAHLNLANPVETDEHLEQRADGAMRWLQWTDQAIFDDSGQLIEIQAVGRDITPLKEAQTQLQSIINSVPEGVLLINVNGYVRLANPIAEQYLEVLWVDEEDGRLHRLGNLRLIDLFTSPPPNFWYEIIANERYFEATARPVEHGLQYPDWVVLLRDVTQERQMQRRVQEQERLSAVGKLAAGIAHDFNNILAVITLYTQMILQTSELNSRNQERLQIIDQQAHRASELIQQILDFSRQSVLTRQALEMRQFLTELVRLLRRTLPETIQITFEADKENYTIYADAARMQQVIINLAVNARDAMPDGGTLLIRLSHLQNRVDNNAADGLLPGFWVVVEISDNGTGIPPEARSRIFEPFFTTKEVGKGTGLGLSQVYGIVQQHEGLVEVKSESGEGTTFLLYFPAYFVETTSLPLLPITLTQGQHQTVLLVEDNEVAQQALVDTLQFLNYQVVQVKNGREALTLLTDGSHKIDLILSDVVMPEMGGIALFHAIREQGLTLPVILLTGHPMSQELEALQANGLAGWLPKPANINTLAQLLASVIE